MVLYYWVTGFDREIPRIGKPLMRIPSLVFYFHARYLLEVKMAALS
jgi:hypothetical protein